MTLDPACLCYSLSQLSSYKLYESLQSWGEYLQIRHEALDSLLSTIKPREGEQRRKRGEDITPFIRYKKNSTWEALEELRGREN